MANPLRGEITVEVDGQEYRLVLSLNALVELQHAVGKPHVAVFEGAARGDLADIRALFWAALRKHHGDMSLDDVGDWIDRAGLERLAGQMAGLASSAVPDPDDARTLGLKPGRPRKAQPRSTSRRSFSAPDARG